MLSDKTLYILAAGVLAVGVGHRYSTQWNHGSELAQCAISRAEQLASRASTGLASYAEARSDRFSDREDRVDARVQAAFDRAQARVDRMQAVVARRNADAVRVNVAVAKVNARIACVRAERVLR